MPKTLELTEQQTKFLEYIRDKFPDIDDEVYKDAKAYAGYAETTTIRSIFKGLGAKLKDEIDDILNQYTLEAAAKQINIMRNPGAKWRAEHTASNNILEKAGIGAKEDNVNIQPVGLVILPAKAVDTGSSD